MLRLTLCLAVILSLSACGTSLNPFNWFGNDRAETVTVVDTSEDADIRPLVAEVLSLSVDPVPQGAIIRATGLPPTQGFWGVDLVESERTERSITYEFRVVPPAPAPGAAVSTQRSRELIVATELSTFELSGIRTITVVGAQNRRSVNRR